MVTPPTAQRVPAMDYVATVYPNGTTSVWYAHSTRFAVATRSAAKRVAATLAAAHSLRTEVVLMRFEGEALVARWRGHNATGERWQWRDTTPADARPRGVCPACGGSHPLTRRGTLARHRRSDGVTVRDLRGARRPAPCDGAARVPAAAAR